MIRLRPLRPREARNLRHWAMEFVVVVLGVLIALWAAEWAEGRRESQQMRIAEQAVRDEIVYNITAIEVWAAHYECTEETAAYYLDRLRKDGRNWEGFTRGSLREDPARTETYRQPFAITLYELRSSAWDSAQANGWLARFDPERRERYEDLYFLFEEVTEQIGYFLEATRAMRPYADADRLEPAARRALVGYVIDEEMAVAQIERMAGWERKSRSEIAWSDEERAAYKTLIDDWAEIVEKGGPVRDCYDPPDPELAVEAAT